MTNSQVLSAMIEGLYRDKASATLPAGFALAPPSTIKSARGEFLAIATDGRFDDRKDAGKAGSFSADYQKGEFNLAPINVNLNSVKSTQYHLPEAGLASITNSPQAVDAVMNFCADQIYGGYTRELQTQISSAGLVSGSAFNLSTGSADIVDGINDTLRAIRLASGYSPNTIYMGMATFHAMMNQDQVQAGSAISGFTSAGSAVRRLGSVTPDAVYNFFKSRFGLDLIVDDRVIINSSGAAAFGAGNDIVIALAGPEISPSCFKTFYLGTYTPSTLLEYDVREASGSQARGLLVGAEAVYGIKCIDPKLGATCSVTL